MKRARVQLYAKPTPLTYSIKVKGMCPSFESDSIAQDKDDLKRSQYHDDSIELDGGLGVLTLMTLMGEARASL